MSTSTGRHFLPFAALVCALGAGLIRGADEPENTAALRQMFQAPSAPGRFVPDEVELAASLTLSLAPDVSLWPAAPDIGFVHRTTSVAKIHFCANTDFRPRETTASFRIGGFEPQDMDRVAPVPAGLFGPVRLIAAADVALR